MSRPTLSPQANHDLREIWDYIAQFDSRAADGVIIKISRAMELLAELPGTGSSRPDLAVDLRIRAVGKYVIYYKPLGNSIVVVRVMHGRQNVTPETFE